MTTAIEIPYSPRPLQAELHAALDDHRFAVVVTHRRFGKTVCAINHLLKAAVLCELPNPRFAYLSPTYRQSKAVAFDYLKTFAGAIPGAKFHETELRCDLPNGARISLLGAENPASLRGIYLDGCVIDEVADCPESVFAEVIRPSLADRKGWCLFIGTPRGTGNYFYELWETAQTKDGWLAAMYKASDTQVLDEEELEAARATMSEDQFEQEFEGSWTANVPGAIYGKEMTAALDDGRITKVPYDPAVPVDTFWDLGIGDATAIVFTQTVGRAIHVIDCYEASNEGLPHFCRILQDRDYLYGDHYAPHDIEVRELSTGKARREIAWDLGLNFRVVPKLPLEDGIHAAQLLLKRCWWDQDACKPAIEAMRHYHRAWNERLRTFRLSPVHDWSSHFADAFRYLATGLRESRYHQEVPQAFAEGAYNPLSADTTTHTHGVAHGVFG